MRRVQAAIRQLQPGLAVELAFLEFMAPNLTECIAAQIAEGKRKIVIMPMFIAQGGHLKKDVPQLLGELRATYPDAEFVLGDAIGAHEMVVQAMARATLLEAGLPLAS